MILGIDLGTTNSLASTVIDGTVEFVEFENSKLLPSVVSFDGESELMIGQPAKNRYFLDPHNSVKSIKRLMGSTEQTQLNGQSYLPEEISAMILRHIKTVAETQFECTFTDAVITVPAYFSDDQRKATAAAGEIAGFNVKRIINEPTAASLSYNLNNKKEIKAVVYDLGGGTFDVSVVNISESIVEVISSHGNNALGDDFDSALTDLLLDTIEETYGRALGENPRVRHQLLAVAEKCKVELSDQPFSTIIENIMVQPDEPPLTIELEISREQFETIITPYIEETMNLVHVALSDAGLQTADIDQILLVGGSSKIPLIAEEFEAIFKLAPTGSIDPDTSVCLGAAIQGAIIGNDKIDAVLVDVTPYTFGTRVAVTGAFGMIEDDDRFVPLIKRNSPLPVSKSKVFYKMHPDQNEIRVEVYQGDKPKARENKLIGSFKVHDLAKNDSSGEIILTMKLDLSGILTVIATEKKTGNNKRITIDNSFNPADISESINKLSEFFEPGGLIDPDENPVTEEEDPAAGAKLAQKVYIAQTMIEKAKAKLTAASPEDRDEMQTIITRLKEEIVQKDIPEIERLIDELTDILFYVD